MKRQMAKVEDEGDEDDGIGIEDEEYILIDSIPIRFLSLLS